MKIIFIYQRCYSRLFFSSLSTSLNSMSTVVLEDFVKPFRSSKLSERETNTIMRAVVLIFGILCVTLIFVVEKSDTVLQVR